MKIVLYDEHSAARQEALPLGRERDWIAARQDHDESVRTNLKEEPPLLELRLLRQLEAFGELHHQTCRNLCSLVSEYLKDLEECMDDGDSKVAKEAKLFDALEYKSIVIEVDNQKNFNLYQYTTSSLW
ncbi:hypothetical protein Tco_1276863 [Tanacetum coccineum]